jgi:DNA polymerase
MPLSATVVDATRGWLALQRDLGGDDVILDRPLEPLSAGATPLPAALTAPKAAAVPAGVPAGDNAWRKGAPPIPGPGMVVTLPAFAHEGDPAWASLDAMAAMIAGCRNCPLCEGRTMTVPGEGNHSARLMLVGEGPGESEDLSGRPFVGRAGELLDKILASMDAPRESVFIANVVKCRPPRNRAPLPDERETCMPYLRRQIELVRPKVLLALGSTAAEALLGVKKPLIELRNRVHRWGTTPLIVTYHPAALLRNPNWKRPAWDDVRIARQLLDLDD